MFTTFADPKTDFIFKRIFGTETNKHLLVALLNDLLELGGENRIRDVTYLPPEQSPPLPEMKLSLVDVCQVEARQEALPLRLADSSGGPPLGKRTVAATSDS